MGQPERRHYLLKDTYAAVDPKISARRAFVRTPTLKAKAAVYPPIKPSRTVLFCTRYRFTIAPTRIIADMTMLSAATAEEILRSEKYAREPSTSPS
jgi:hypothetical protein